MPRKLLWLILSLVAFGVPPVVYNAKDWWLQTKQRVAPLLSLSASGGSVTGAEAAGIPASSVSGVPARTGQDSPSPGIPAPPGESTTRVDLAEVLRFDITPDWVMQRWPWISAGLSHLALHGYRVPLVTGTASDDVAGSLTYYFNANQRVEQITLEGTTGDPSALLRVVIGRYGFARRITNNPGLFRYELPSPRGPAKSYLDLRLIQPNDPHRRYQIELTIVRPE